MEIAAEKSLRSGSTGKNYQSKWASGHFIMSKSKLPNSLRKYLRREKSRIRGTVSDRAQAEKEIQLLVEKVMAQCKKTTYNKKS